MKNPSNHIIVALFYWHFVDAPKFLLQVWKNFLSFGNNFFSIPLLLKTLFTPWRRYKWSYGKGFDIQRFFNAIASNFISRFLGMICRLALVFAGILFQVLVLALGAVIFLFWIFLPIICFAGLLFSFGLI